MSKCYVFMFGCDYSKINRTSQPFKCQALQWLMSLFRYLFFFRYFCQINYRKYQQSNAFSWLLFSSSAFSSLKNSTNLVSYFFSLNAWMSYNFAIFRIKLLFFLICGINNLLELWLNMDHTSAWMTSSRNSWD